VVAPDLHTLLRPPPATACRPVHSGCVPPKEASNQLHCVFKEAHATVLRTSRRLAGHCLFEKAAQWAASSPILFDLNPLIGGAKALGLEVPPYLQQRADEVIRADR
jgi:hypothetical protein